jgi:hypothetical protein
MLGAKHSSFDPTAVQMMADALDEAWADIEATADPRHRYEPEETRLALAKRIIELASDGYYDAGTLRDAALASVRGPCVSLAMH